MVYHFRYVKGVKNMICPNRKCPVHVERTKEFILSCEHSIKHVYNYQCNMEIKDCCKCEKIRKR